MTAAVVVQKPVKIWSANLCHSFSEDDVSERYTTWSNMVKQKEPASATTEHGERGERGRTRTREENNINNNMDSSRKSRYDVFSSTLSTHLLELIIPYNLSFNVSKKCHPLKQIIFTLAIKSDHLTNICYPIV